MTRKLHDYILLVIRGMVMGAADVVPGVSGGTIAFVTGIYEELINTIKSLNLDAIKTLFSKGPVPFWKHINGNFLLAVVFGILLSVLTLAQAMQELMQVAPVLLWSFFFGLIIGSAISIARKIEQWGAVNIIFAILGAAIAYFITDITPAATPEAWWFILICGSIAICAMILPGVSGAFILLMFGKYEYILNALTSLKLDVILLFGAGAAAGIISFSNVLSWLLKKWKDTTTAVLMGFMIGALNKVWPWKETKETFIDRHGVEKPLIENNVLPSDFELATGNDPQMMFAIGLILTGLIIMLLFEKVISGESRPKEVGQ